VVTIEGVLTTALGALESSHGGFIQDASGGIALYLDAPVVGMWPSGMTVTVEGTVSSRFSQRTLRISESALIPGPTADLPAALPLETGAASEFFEGQRVRLSGTIIGAPDQLTDGLGVTLDDGSGTIRAVVGPEAVNGRSLASGMVATISGPLGQRDSSGTGTAGYRVHVTLPGELELAPTATPSPVPTPTPSPTPAPTETPDASATASPSASPSPTAVPTPSPIPTPTATATPTATPKPSPSPTPPPATVSLDAVRALPIGSTARTTGVVVAEDGRLGSPNLLGVGDATAGLVVHLPSGAGAYPRGTRLDVTGKLSAPYGQLEIRPAKSDIHLMGIASLPASTAVPSAGLTEALEGRLVTVTGRLTVKPTKSASGDLTFALERDGATAVKVMADASSRLGNAAFQRGATYRIMGFVGQRATRSGALDGYRVWLRDPADVSVVSPATSSPSTTPGSGSPAPGATTVASISISRALKITDRTVAIEATVTAPATLLDASGRRIVAQDPSAAVELLLPTGSDAPPVGSRIHAEGRIGVAYGAPRLRVDRYTVDGSGSAPAPLVLHTAPAAAHEWRLVSVNGQVLSVHKLGDRWRAEIAVGKDRVVVVGQPGAGIASTTLVEGRSATVVGIVRRPAPTASDHRFAVTPRFPADVHVSGQPGPGQPAGAVADAAGNGSITTVADGSAHASASAAIDADLDGLAPLAGQLVRVGGLVVDLRTDGFTLDDGTAIGRIVLRGAALDLLPLIEPDDALNAIGRVETSGDGYVVAVDDPGAIILTGDPVAATGPAASQAVGAAGTSDVALGTSRFAGIGSPALPIDAGAAGLGTLLAISVLSVAVTLLRRSRSRRRLAARIASRLASLAGPAEALRDPNVAEREPSTNHAA
jgi:hypothetical protein